MVNKFDSLEPVNGQPPPAEVRKLQHKTCETDIRQDNRHARPDISQDSRQVTLDK